MPRLSIVIPSLQFDMQVEDTLVSVLQHRPEHSEVLVVTADRYDDPYKLGREVRFLSHSDSASRLDLANFGCREARGDVVHLLMPGALATEGWTDHILRHFSKGHVAAVAPVLMSATKADRTAAVGVTYLPRGERRIVGAGVRSQNLKLDRCAVLAPMLSAGFYRRDTLLALQGFDGDFGEQLADVELGLALRDLGMSTVLEPMSHVTVGPTLGESPRTFQEARNAERLYRRHAVRSNMNTMGHAILIAAEVLTGFLRFRMITRPWGRMAARRDADARPGYAARLDHARTQMGRTTEEVSTILVEFGDAQASTKDRMPAATRGRRSAA